MPASNVPGERAAATQPFPTRPAAFEIQGVNEEDLIDFSPELREEALAIINQYDHALFTPPSLKGTVQIQGTVEELSGLELPTIQRHPYSIFHLGPALF